MLAAYVNTRLTDWDDLLPPVMMAYRSSVHRTLDETPNAMLLGREVRLPMSAMVGLPPEADYDQKLATDYAADLSEAMQQAHSTVAEHMDASYSYQKKQYDRNVKVQTLQVGQAVWLRVYLKVRGKSKSLMRPWDGPWVITTKLSEVNFRIRKTKKGS